MAKKIAVIIGSLLIGILLVCVYLIMTNKTSGILSPLGNFYKTPEPTPKPLEKYSFEELKKRGGKAGEIKVVREIGEREEGKSFTSYLFEFTSEGRKITGLMNLPDTSFCTPEGLGVATAKATPSTGSKTCQLPVIVMLRGYVDREIYETGVGTQHAGEYFANRGFITLAPDFLGYGESEMPPNNVWEERFLRPLNVLDLLASIGSLTQADVNNIFIWGHSNGGMIALAVLEISGKEYPTTLWAPVSKFFPYDVLYYTDEADDKGKSLRQSLAYLEKDYDVDRYSIDSYFDWIKAPLQIHQGLVDEAVPYIWTNTLVEKLEKLDKDVTYHTYSGADHNMLGAWETVVARDVEFFRKNLFSNE